MICFSIQIGSFQVVVHEYKDATEFIQHLAANPLSVTDGYEFQLEFERMVILDYIIRNTDRGSDNWLVRYEPLDLQHPYPVDIPVEAVSEKIQ